MLYFSLLFEDDSAVQQPVDTTSTQQATPRNSSVGFGYTGYADNPKTLDQALGNGLYRNDQPTVHNATDVNDYIRQLEQDNERIRAAYSKETSGRSTNPGSSWWSWVPFSDESQAQNRIAENEAEIRRMKNEPELFDHKKNGTPAPGFTDHPIGWTANAVADNYKPMVLGAAGLAGGAWQLNKKLNERKQGLGTIIQNGFDRRYY